MAAFRRITHSNNLKLNFKYDNEIMIIYHFSFFNALIFWEALCDFFSWKVLYFTNFTITFLKWPPKSLRFNPFETRLGCSRIGYLHYGCVAGLQICQLPIQLTTTPYYGQYRQQSPKSVSSALLNLCHKANMEFNSV